MWRRRLLESGPDWPSGTLPRVSPEQQQVREAFLSSVSAEKPEVKAEAEPGDLSANAAKLMIKFILEPGTTLTEAYADLGLHPAEGKAAIDELLARGFARPEHLPRKGRGGQYVVVEITQRANRELERRCITRLKPVLKGGFKHDVYGRWLAKWASARGLRHWYERTLGKKTYDFVYETPEARLIAVEVCVTGTARWCAEQAIKGAENEGVFEVVVACETKKFADEVMAELVKSDELGLYRGRIKVCQLAEFLEC